MSKSLIFSIIESAGHPNFSNLYHKMAYDELKLTSVRRAISALKKQKPDIIIAQFLFSFSTNYASNHISNLDSLIITLQKYPDYKPKFIFLVNKQDVQHISQLTNHYNDFSSSHHALILPATEAQMEKLLLI